VSLSVILEIMIFFENFRQSYAFRQELLLLRGGFELPPIVANMKVRVAARAAAAERATHAQAATR
jgi:hypothetical protein